MWKLCFISVLCVIIDTSLCNRWMEYEWDILIFTQSWPNTVCREWKEENKNHTCLLPKLKNEWTIHGIWPTKLGTRKPGYCNDTWIFEENKISSIEDELIIYWPNIFNGSRVTSLWEHEWEKHGTCAASLPSLDSEEKYFRQGLEWSKEYNLTRILSQSGIKPSAEELSVQEVVQAIKDSTQKNPAVECIRDSETQEEYLQEIRICFDKTLNIVDCDGIKSAVSESGIITNCPPRKGIVYPANVPEVQKAYDDNCDEVLGKENRKQRLKSPNEPWYFTLLKVATFLQWFTL